MTSRTHAPLPEQLPLPQQQYIEVIAALVREKGRARMTDVAARLAVKPPSASEAVRRLTEQGLTTHASRARVGLTAAGKRIAERLDYRHRTLRAFVADVMGMDPADADTVACRVEHCVDKRFTDRLLALVQILVEEHPRTLAHIVRRMRGSDGLSVPARRRRTDWPRAARNESQPGRKGGRP
jgi:DtxR family Mn-dependent transcriptional regulator